MALVYVADRYTDYFVSGTSRASSPDYRTHYYIYYDDNQDVANNRTRIKIDYYLKMVGTRTPTDMSSGVYINGSSTNNYISIPQKSYSTGTYYLGSKDWYIYHDSSGNGSYTFRGILYGGGIWTNRYTTGTTTYTLPTIPRYTSITNFYTQNITLTSFSFVVTASDAIDWVQHSLNGGAWTDSGNQVISGLQPGTQYSLRTRVRRTSSGLWTESGTIYATTTQINQITSANPSGNSDNELKVTANNPSGNRNDIKLEFPDLGLVEILRINSTLSATFTAEQMESLANLIPDKNSTKLRATAVTVVGGTERYWHYKDGTYTVLNANPTFNNFEYADTGGDTLIPEVKTTDLTGNNQVIIKGYSNLKTTVKKETKAVANKGATMETYQLVIGAKQTTQNYKDDEDVDLSLNAIDNNVFIIYAIDSRGNSTNYQKSPEEYIDYFRPVINDLVINRENNISTFVNLSFTGTFLNVDFGAEINEITAKYQYRNTKSDEWIIGDTDLTLDISDNNFSFNNSIAGDLDAEGFSISESFEIKIIVEDLLSTNEKSEILVSATPNLSMHQDGTAINNQYDDTLGSGLQLNGENIYYNGITLFEWIDE